jgi:leucine dehydrogenase
MHSAITPMNILDTMRDLDHEQVMFCQDKDTGLKAIIAIHHTGLGPALGGTRMWNYASDAEALNDVLRLSRGMTYKSSLAGLNLGGGKAVIIGDAKTIKTEALLRRFGRFIQNLGGKYITAEDVSMNSKDMSVIRMETPHVCGLPENQGGSGDPSPVTAYGVYVSMKAAAKSRWSNESLQGKRILVQGLGNVGASLLDHLHKEGAKLFINDINSEREALMAKRFQATVIPASQLWDKEYDIYAPCALGATLNDESIQKLKCEIICGAANNQLLDEARHGSLLSQKNMLYAPDFVVNAGGIINVYYELEGYNRERALSHAEGIYHTLTRVIELSTTQSIPTYLAANQLAELRLNQISALKIKR